MQNLKNKISRLIAALCILMLFAGNAAAQKTRSDSIRDDMDFITKQAVSGTGQTTGDSVAIDSALKVIVNEELSESYNKYSMMHLQRSLGWQFYSSIIIFCLVIFIVVFGLYLSFLQFKIFEKITAAALKAAEKDISSKALEEGSNMLRSDVGISKDGLKINSAVVGLVILFISLGFFFLYLKYVYKIEVLNPFKPA